MGKIVVGSDFASKVQDRLQGLFKQRGYGTKARVERELGLYDGFFDNRRARGDLGVGVLIATLNVLEVDAGAFLAEALGREVPKDDTDSWNDDPPPPAKWPAIKPIARKFGVPVEDDEDDENRDA